MKAKLRSISSLSAVNCPKQVTYPLNCITCEHYQGHITKTQILCTLYDKNEE